MAVSLGSSDSRRVLSSFHKESNVVLSVENLEKTIFIIIIKQIDLVLFLFKISTHLFTCSSSCLNSVKSCCCDLESE